MRYRMITPEALQGMLRGDSPPLLIDVLTDEHFQAVRLPGAVNVCVYETDFLDRIAGVVQDHASRIVLYGASDNTLEAFTAAEKLVGRGYTGVSVLKGGLREWKAAGCALEGDDIGILDRAEVVLPADNTRYALDCEQSTIHWYGRNRKTTHYGTVRLSSGEIGIRKGRIRGIFEIDMASIEDLDLQGDLLHPDLVAHLRSEDFFFVRMFPTATFTISSAEQIEEVPSSLPNFRVNGAFELRGLVHPVEFLATVGPMQDGELRIEAHFDIDRTRWGVLYGSSRFFEHLGSHLVYNLVTIQLRLVAREKTEKRRT